MSKNRDEIIQDILKRFEDHTEMVNVEPGSIVRTFSEVLSEEFNQFYSELNLVSTMSFVSTARGQFLDLLGAMLNCVRLVGEEDENYRMRITNYVYVIAGANYISIRLKLLEITGVKDVILEQFTKGTGSFTAYVISDHVDTPTEILQEASRVVERCKGYGIHADIRRPTPLDLYLEMQLILKEGTSLTESSNIKENVKIALKRYVDNIDIGGDFILTQAITVARNVSDSIVDLQINRMFVRKTERFVRNLRAARGERFLLQNIEIL